MRHAQPGSCRGCGKAVLWAKTAADKSIPLDPLPTHDGNLVMADLEHVRARKPDDDPSLIRWTSHFATCPKAPVFRRLARNAAARAERNRAGSDD